MKIKTILIAAAALRLAFWLLVLPLVFPDRDISSAGGYDLLARSVVEGKGFAYADGTIDFFRTPAYTLFIAAHYKMFGMHNGPILFSQLLVSVLMVWLVWRLSRKLGLSEFAAGLAALMLALNPFAVWRFPILLADVLLPPLVLWMAILCVQWTSADSPKTRMGLAALAGCVAGLAVMTKPISALYPGVVCLFWLVDQRPTWFEKIRSIFMLGLCCGLVVLPWIVRNYNHTGDFPVISAGSSIPRFHGLTYPETFKWSDMNEHRMDTAAQKGYEVVAKKLDISLLSTPGRLSYEDDKRLAAWLNENQSFGGRVRCYAWNLLFFWILGNSHFKSLAYVLLYGGALLVVAAGLPLIWKNQRRIPMLLGGSVLYFWLLNSWIIGATRYADPAVPFLFVLVALVVEQWAKRLFPEKLGGE